MGPWASRMVYVQLINLSLFYLGVHLHAGAAEVVVLPLRQLRRLQTQQNR